MTASGPGGEAVLLDPADLAPLDREKGLRARALVRLEDVTDPDGASFDRAWSLLDDFFGPRGEMEARAAIAGFVRRRVLDFGPGLEGHYRLLAAWHGEELVGVRDCYVDIDRNAGVCVVALSHSLVVPAWRRSGLAALLRAVPVSLARSVLAEHVGGTLPTLIAAEMEPVDPDDPDSVVRLFAYARSGFCVLDPPRFRYAQPEFRDRPGATHLALPLLGVVRPVGIGGDALPAPLVAAYPRLFHACHRTWLPTARVDPAEAHCMAHLGADPVPLLPLPTDATGLQRLAPLLRSAVLPLYPPALRGPGPDPGPLDEALRRLRERWG